MDHPKIANQLWYFVEILGNWFRLFQENVWEGITNQQKYESDFPPFSNEKMKHFSQLKEIKIVDFFLFFMKNIFYNSTETVQKCVIH